MKSVHNLSGVVTRSWRVLLKEVSAFGLVALVTFPLEILIYQVMYVNLHQGALVSKVISTGVTATIAYFAHRHWAFSHRARTGLRREYTLFIILSVVSLLLSLIVIGAVRYGLGRTDVFSLQIANVASIGLGAVFRFWAYKRWVFPAALPADQMSPTDTGSTA